jgi:indolepyruvate decarboxylase
VTEHSLETSVAERLQSTSVADYIVQCIADEGIARIALESRRGLLVPDVQRGRAQPKGQMDRLCERIERDVRRDGDARIRGVGMLAITYGVGKLSAPNDVMGAKAERSLVFYVVGMPFYQNQRMGKTAHQTLDDGNFGNFASLSAAAPAAPPSSTLIAASSSWSV